MSIILFCKGFEDQKKRYLSDESPSATKFKEIVKDLEKDGHTYQGSIKLISSKSGIKYLRAKLSDSDRLLFTSTKYNNEDAFIMLEVIPNHDYSKSAFLGSNSTTKTVEIEERKGTEVSDTVEIKDLERAHWLGKLITFTAKQEDIAKDVENCKLPLVISGAAGSGKTSVALESLKKMQEKFKGGKILYTTKSVNLIKESKKLFKREHYDETTGELKTDVPEEMDFLSVHEFFETIIKKDIEGKKPINRNKFFSWFNEICKKDKFKEYRKDGDKIFEEFTAVIGGVGLLEENGKDRYYELGSRQSMFSKDKRNSVYDFFKEYRKFIEKDSEYYDPNLVAHKCTEAKEYDAVIVDEVQDLTESTLDLMLKSLKDESKGNFLLCGDVNQVIHPSFFSLSKLQLFLNRNKYVENRGSEIFYTLEKNHRNSEQVIELANRVLHLKNYCFASEDKMTADEKEAFLMESNIKNVGNVSVIANDEKRKEVAEKVPSSINWAVLVLDDENKKNARELFDTPLVFNIHEAKGLEFENVILYKFTSYEAYDKIWNVVCSKKGKLKIENTIERIRNLYKENDIKTSRSKNKEDKSFEENKFYINALYVAVTRAISNLYIIEDGKECNLLKVIRPEKDGNVNIKTEESNPEEWKDLALELIDKGNIEQAKNIVKRLLSERKGEHAKEIMNALKVQGYGKKGEEVQSILDKDRSEQTVLKLKTEHSIPQESLMGKSGILTKNSDQKKVKKHTAKLDANKVQQERDKSQKKKPLEKNNKLVDLISKNKVERLKKIDISQYDKQEILNLALKYSSWQIVNYLIKDKNCTIKGSDLDTSISSLKGTGYTLLHLAAREDLCDLIELLLDNEKFDVNVRGKEDLTPLHCAVAKGRRSAVELFFKNKEIDVNARNKNGITPLYLAMIQGSKCMIELLLKNEKVDVNAKSDEGHTSLHLAVQENRKDVVELLLKNEEVDIDARNSLDFAPLHLAAQIGHTNVVKLFLQHGGTFKEVCQTAFLIQLNF